MNTKLRTAEHDFEKYFFILMNNSIMISIDDNKLITTNKRRNRLVSEPNYHTTKRFSENLLAIEMKKAKVKMNKSVYLGMLILKISKTLTFEFWYDYIKPKYKNNATLCYMDTDRFIIHIETEDFL